MTSPLADNQPVLIIPAGADQPVPLVRLWVAAAIEGVPLAAYLKVGLVVDELVSNARRHGRFPCLLRLSLDDTRRHLFVFVDDAAADDGADWVTGAGLAVVDGLAANWGVQRRSGGKSVWAALPLDVRVAGLSQPSQPPPEAWTGCP